MSTKGKNAPPSLNKFMHPRNPYRTPPSFKKLATKYPEFRSHCTYDLSDKVHLDFKNSDALRALTSCLLDQDFGLKVNIPSDRLVPTLPLRLNYLLWIEDLMTLAGHTDHKCSRIGVDIGTGSSCIYPLLAAKKFGWSMLCTEKDEINYFSAVSNIKENCLQDDILIKKVQEHTVFQGILDDEAILAKIAAFRMKIESKEEQQELLNSVCGDNSKEVKGTSYIYDFTMCNPPFFGSEEDTITMNKSKKNRSEPVSAPTGAIQEMVTSGGEVSFITQMIEESSLLRDKVRIFTTMIGTKADIKKIKQALTTVGPAQSSVTEFCQGRTMRWGLAWTFDPKLQLNKVVSKKQMANAKPLIMLLPHSLMGEYSIPAAWRMVSKWLRYLKVKVRVFKDTKYFLGANVKAYKPTWLHQRRKKRELERKKDKMQSFEEKGEEVPGVKENPFSVKEDDDLSEENTEVPILSKKRMKDECDSYEEEADSKKQKVSEDRLNQLANGADSGQQMVKSPNDSGIGNSPIKEMTSNSNLSTQINENFHRHEKETRHQSGGLESILRFNIHLKQAGKLISIELTYLGGSAGKNGLNQLLLFMRNQLTNPTL